MMKKKPEQSEKFIETAKEHGCDESENKFSEKMKKLASAPSKKKEDKNG